MSLVHRICETLSAYFQDASGSGSRPQASLVNVDLTVDIPLSEELKRELRIERDSFLFPLSGKARIFPLGSGDIILGAVGRVMHLTNAKWRQIIVTTGQDPSLTLSATFRLESFDEEAPSLDEVSHLLSSLVADGWKINNYTGAVKEFGAVLGVLSDDHYVHKGR